MIATTQSRKFSLSQWLERRRFWCYVAAFAGLQAVVQFPVWNSTLPALSDYPNHLARMHILFNAGHSVDLNQFYEIHWSVLPNLAMDAVVPLLAAVIGIELASKAFLALVLLLISSGTFGLHYALHGRLSLWPFAVYFFLYNQIFIDGIINYLFGIGVALWAIAAWISTRSSSKLWRLPVFTLIALLLFFCHLSAYCFYASIISAYEIRCIATDNKWKLSWPTLIIDIATLAAPVVLFLLLSPTGEGAGQGFNWFGLSFPMYVIAMLAEKLFSPFALVNNYNHYLDCVTLLAIGVLLIRGVFSKSIIIDRSMVFSLISLSIIFLFTPPLLYGSYMADWRMVVAFIFAFIGVSDLSKNINPRLQTIVISILVSLFFIRMGVIVSYWADADRLAASYSEAFEKLPAGKRLFSAFPEQLTFSVFDSYEQFLPCLAIISRSAFVPSLYTLRGAQPTLLTPLFQALKDRTPGPLFSNGKSPNWSQVMQDYDYILIAEPAKFSTLPTNRLLTVVKSPYFRLYQVMK